jgi:hypothetical protein
MIIDACDLISLAIDKKNMEQTLEKAKNAIAPLSLICPKALW